MHLTPEFFVIVFAILLGLFLARVFQYRIDVITRRAATISRVEEKLDLLLAQAGLKFDVFQDSPAQ